MSLFEGGVPEVYTRKIPKYHWLVCSGPLKPEVVWSTNYGRYYARHVLVLAEEDSDNNIWLADGKTTTDQGFKIKVDNCERMISGIQIKNKGKEKGSRVPIGTKNFRVSGSSTENGPWETLLEAELENSTHKLASLTNFTFSEPVEILYLKFDLISYWGAWGGGLQYFAAIPASQAESKESEILSTGKEIC